MIRQGTGLISTLRLVYKNYGGFQSLFRSAYFYLAALVSAASWRYATTDEWAKNATDILPTLAGFTIAAYAVVFSVLDEKARKALGAPVPALGGRSPLLALVSAISHGIFVQMSALVWALVFLAKPFPMLPEGARLASTANTVAGSVGLFLTNYGIVLVVASIMSIYRLLEIRSRV